MEIKKTDTPGLYVGEPFLPKGKVVPTKLVMKENGKKFDQDKIPMELLPTEALREIAKVLKFGSEKYDAWNWKKGMKWSRLAGAALRHLYAWLEREDKDPETNLSHLAHLGCCVLFLLTYETLGIGIDDRWKPQEEVPEPPKPPELPPIEKIREGQTKRKG